MLAALGVSFIVVLMQVFGDTLNPQQSGGDTFI